MTTLTIGSQPIEQVVTLKQTSQPINGKRKLSANSAASTGYTSKKARPTEGNVKVGSFTSN